MKDARKSRGEIKIIYTESVIILTTAGVCAPCYPMGCCRPQPSPWKTKNPRIHSRREHWKAFLGNGIPALWSYALSCHEYMEDFFYMGWGWGTAVTIFSIALGTASSMRQCSDWFCVFLSHFSPQCPWYNFHVIISIYSETREWEESNHTKTITIRLAELLEKNTQI